MTRILVIEDDTAIRDTVTDVLEFAGYSVLKANNGISGLEMAQAETPDLILCDIMLPGLDGYGVKLALNNAPQASSTPFIFITARSTREDFRQGMTLGADDYLTKPFSSRELLDVVATRIARYQQIAVSRATDLEALREYINLTLPHELRTPLTSMLGYLTMARDGVDTLNSDAMRDMLGQVERSSMRLHHLIERYVAYAQLRLISTNPELIAALREVGDEMPLGLALRHTAEGQAELAGRKADLHLDVQLGSAAIVGEHFERLITVLLENAFKFSEPGTPVTLTGRAEPPVYLITIRDRGRGMTPDQIRRIGANVQFERRTYEQQGVGLGLAMAYQIVHIYGGSLLLESKPGEGATARLELPLQ
ncbi:MAG: response regulator [Anaerolineae bacterium]|nr:response regulator [Anaerolineae bacterium]